MNTGQRPAVRVASVGLTASSSPCPPCQRDHGLSLNSLDVMSGLDTVKICTAYMYKGERIENYPANLKVLEQCEASLRRASGMEGRFV